MVAKKHYLVIGDIHGRTIWKYIIDKEAPDKVIFLGDYVTSHEGISAEIQLNNLEDILTFKEDFPDKIILLRGNHDLRELGYYWAECFPNEPNVQKVMSVNPLKSRFESLTQWIYIDEELKTVFSHAGISQVWMNNNNIKDIHDINNLEPSEIFAFTSDNYFDMTGNSETQPPTWIRPGTLIECNIEGWRQVVGHTPVQKGVYCIHDTVGQCEIWLCDALGLKKYLIIDNGKFQPKTL